MSNLGVTVLNRAISPRRIARSLVTVIVLTLTQAIAGPVLLPQYSTPNANAATLYGNVGDFQQWTTWQTNRSNHTPFATSDANGSAITSNSDTINLTQNANSQSGSLWNTQVFSYSNDFSVSASYFFGVSDGADGIFFQMKPLGQWPNGGTAGAANGTPLSGSAGYISLFFDTFNNGSFELVNDHLTVNAYTNSGTQNSYATTGGVTGVPLYDSAGTELTDVEDDKSYPFTIVWKAVSRTLAVFGGANADRQFFSTTIPVAEMDATNFSFGWHGITGGLNNYQAINNVQYHVGPTINSSPANSTVANGDQVSLTSSYTSREGTPTTRWEYSTDGGTSWISTGVTSTTYTFTATRGISGQRYRYRVETSAFGTTHWVASTPMRLFVTASPPVLGTDNAMNFNGSAQYASAGDDDSLDVSNAITIEAWVKPTALPANGSWSMVVNKAASYEIGIMTTNSRSYWSYGLQGNSSTAWRGESTTVAVALNEWHHIAITRAADSSTVKFYYDGNLAYVGTSDVAGTGNLNNSSYPLTIGSRFTVPSSYVAPFTGTIDQVAIFGIARTDAQIKSDVYNYLDTATSGLQAFYDFNESSGSTTIFNRVASSPAASDLTPSGSPTYEDVKEVGAQGPYTVVKFPRTYLPATGGWIYTGAATKASVLVIGGGGAGGGGYQGGGGGAGGFIETVTSISTLAPYTIKVGAGGKGASNPFAPTDGETSTAFGLSAIGGGRGATEWDNNNGVIYFNVTYPASMGGSGGGSTWGTNNASPGTGITGQGNLGGTGGGTDPVEFAGGGGGGAGTSGYAPTLNFTVGGNGGAGKYSAILGSTVAGGGGGGSRNANGTSSRKGLGTDGGGNSGYLMSTFPGETGGAQNGTTNTGGGGGGSSSANGSVAGMSGFGGSGYVVIRWITATKPNYTKPTNTTLDVGQTETFTVNVANDSETAVLTRTFKWESTTAGASGTFYKIKEGTGAEYASFSWIPADTSTNGSDYLYRLTVTDSDTAGLFISDSSTAYAIINPAMIVSGLRTITKTVNIGKSETFTISFGTGPYQISWLGNEPKLQLETATASSIRLKVSDTATIGTYYETITVIDSVSAVLIIPIVVRVVPVPSILWEGAMVDRGLVLDYQIGNSQSLLGTNGQATTGLTLRDLSGRQNDATTNGTFSNVQCSAPTYSSSNGGALSFGNGKCYYTPYTGDDLRNHYTAEVWFKKTGSFGMNSYLISQRIDTADYASIAIGTMGEEDEGLRVGFYFNGTMRTASCAYIPILNDWTHIAGTYDGNNLITFVNGQKLCSSEVNLVVPDSFSNPQGIIIGAAPNAGNIFINAQIASVRLYGTPLSEFDIADNYHLSKTRFKDGSNYLVSISKKYGSVSQESFTVVSGTDTTTVSFSIGSRTGIIWDSATSSSRIKLNLQESPTVGTYLETITVTDANGSATILPLIINVTVADSLTVTMDSGTTTSYNGLRITSFPKATIRGLVWQDTATTESLFSSDIYSESALAPINADTYTVRGAEPTFTYGSLSNYAGIVYETSTAVINKINQRPLEIFMYGGVVGMPFPITVTNGDGDGAVSETLTGVSSLAGCAINSHVLTVTEERQGFCEVEVVKEGSQNYFSQSRTVQMYFIAYANNLLTDQTGSGPTIALQGTTPLTINDSATVRAPIITGATLSGSTLTITGEGFGNSPLQVVFEVFRSATSATPTNSGQSFTVTVPSGAVSGYVLVKAPGGQAFTEWIDLP